MKKAMILMAAAVLLAVAGCGGGGGGRFVLSSPDFKDGGEMPVKFTCEGENVAPTLKWSGAPEGTQSFALIVEDVDAPQGRYTHWLVCNIPANATSLESGDAPEGLNDALKPGYTGPCPPSQDDAHTYVFRLIALDYPAVAPPAGFDREKLEAYINNDDGAHKLGEASIAATYKKQ